MIVAGLFALLVPLAILVGIAVAIARGVRGTGGTDWGLLVRQFFQHLIAVSLAFVAAWGVSELLTLVLEGSTMVRADETLAGPVAFTVVGVPLYAAMLWWLLGQARRDEREARSLSWSLHLAVVGVVSLVVSLVAVFDLVDGLTTAEGTTLAPWADLVVWGGLWGASRWAEHRLVGSRKWAVLHVVAGAAVGLGVGVAGLGRLVAMAVEAVLLTGDTLVVADDPTDAVVALVLGLAVWGVYWLADGVQRERDAWWHGWVLLGGVLSGLVTMIGSAAWLLYVVAVWLVGEPAVEAATHFEAVPAAIGALVSGAAVWWYHRSILAPRARRTRTEVDRVYDLLLAAVGLGAAATGFATILVAIIEALAGPVTVQSGAAPINTLLAAVTALAVGGPVWWRTWSRMQRIALSSRLGTGEVPDRVADPAMAERRSPTRRVYLFVLFGVGGLAALTSVLVAATDGLEDLFAGDLGGATLMSMRFSLAVLVTAAAVAALHWTVYREDRDLVGESPREYPARVTLVGVADAEVVATLRDATDARVELWTRRHGPFPPWSVDALTSVLHGHDDDHVLVIARPGGPEFIPLDG